MGDPSGSARRRSMWLAVGSLVAVALLGALVVAMARWDAEHGRAERLAGELAEISDSGASDTAALDEREAELEQRGAALDEREAELEQRGAAVDERAAPGKVEALRAELAEASEALAAAEVRLDELTACRLPDRVRVERDVVQLMVDVLGREARSQERDELADVFLSLAEQECAAHRRGENIDAEARFLEDFADRYRGEMAGQAEAGHGRRVPTGGVMSGPYYP